MSTRKLNLLVAAAALALAGGVTAASTSIAAPPPPADGTIPSAALPPAPPGAPTPPTTVSLPDLPASVQHDAAHATDDPKECRDANCVIALKDGQEIVFDRKVGVESLKVALDGDDVTFEVRTKTSKGVTALNAGSPYSSAYFNGIRLRPYKTETGEMILEISRT
ncbi:MAG: hypothetical protein FWJ90_15350 [Actinomadura sp.]